MLKQAGHNRVKAFLVLSAELLQYLFESLYLLSSSVNMATGYYPCCNFRFGKKLQNSKHFISFPDNPAELYCPRSEIAVDPNYWTRSQIRWAPACHRLRQNENTVVIKLKTKSNIVKVYNLMQSIHIHIRMYDMYVWGQSKTRCCLCSVFCACCLYKIGCVGTKENRATTVYQPRLKCINICIQT